MTLVDSTPDACMDPWCLVQLVTGQSVLFGFAVRHPTTGGLSWVRSTVVEEHDAAAGRARTRSGRVYDLGRHLLQEDIPAESLEAWVAYDLLMADDAKRYDAVPPVSADLELDAMWLAARKMAKHLDVSPPNRRPAQVHAFLRRHMDAYVTLRARRLLQ